MAYNRNNNQNPHPYDKYKEDRWMVSIEGQRYYFIEKEKAVRCWKNFWEASEPVLVPYSQYVKDPSR